MAYKFGDFTKGIIKGIGKGVDKVTSTAAKILEPGFTSISKFIDDTFNIPLITGAKEATDYFTGADQAKKAQELAEKQEAWNESFSEKQLAEQTRQFEKSQELAQQNLDYQKEYSEKNYQLQAQQYADQKAENALMREREDTAYQRQVADLKAAGLSPLMASGGASASGATVGSAPQYDMSGVSAAQGSLVQLAQEYAQLRAMSQGQYADRKNQAVNAQIGARQVLADLSMQRKQMGISFAQQAANYGLQLRDFDLRQAETNEKILASKESRNWYRQHGYRNDKFWTVLTPILNSLADNLKIDYDSLKDVFSGFSQTYNITVGELNSMYDGSEEGFKKLKDKTGVLKGSDITKNDYDNMMSVLLGSETDYNTKDFITWYGNMNEEFRNKFTYKQFRAALSGENKFMRSNILKYLSFGNGSVSGI